LIVQRCVVADVEQMLRRDLRRTKALLQDAQLMLQKGRDTAGSRTTVKQLRNQVPADTREVLSMFDNS